VTGLSIVRSTLISNEEWKRGTRRDELTLPGIDDKVHKLSEYKDPILVVMFICDHCPTSQLYEGRMKKLVGRHPL
jgi:hypothetical protein